MLWSQLICDQKSSFSDCNKVPQSSVATDYGKVIYQRHSNPCKAGYALASDVSQKAVGSNPNAGKRFSQKIYYLNVSNNE